MPRGKVLGLILDTVKQVMSKKVLSPSKQQAPTIQTTCSQSDDDWEELKRRSGLGVEEQRKVLQSRVHYNAKKVATMLNSNSFS